MHHYKSQDYQTALTCFYEELKVNPDNIAALTYAANSYYRLGKPSNAISMYWYIVKKYPNQKESFELREFLRQKDTDYAKHSNDKNFGSIPPLSKANSTSQSINKVGLAKSASSANTSNTKKSSTERISISRDQMIKELVHTVKPLKDRPFISNKLIEKVYQALSKYPEDVLRLLYSKGCRIYLTPTMIDKHPEYENTQPRGYMHEGTFKDCPGMFYMNQIIVCEYTIGNGFDWDKLKDPIGTLRHELGHAVDRHLGYVSQSEEFKHAYHLDVGKITDPGDASKLSYYLQKASGGPSETFAEIMCSKFGGRESDPSKANLVLNRFSLATTVVNKKLAEHRSN